MRWAEGAQLTWPCQGLGPAGEEAGPVVQDGEASGLRSAASCGLHRRGQMITIEIHTVQFLNFFYFALPAPGRSDLLSRN